MGLDSYVFRVHKPRELEDRVYTMEEIVGLKLESFRKEEPEESLVADLNPYCREVLVKVPWIDMEKLRREYDLSGDAYVCLRSGDGSVGVMDPENGEYKVFSQNEIKEQYILEKTETYCVFECEQVAYWRKNYDVQNFFYEHVDDVDNTGYYLLDSDVLEEFNDSGDESWGKLHVEEPTVNEALFYHEWY